MTERTESASAARTLDRRILVVWTVQTAVLVLVLAAVVLAVDVGSRLAGTHPPGPPGLAAALVALAGGVAAWLLPNLEYRNWRYEVAEDALELRHGILRRVHSAIPYFRVQHIDVTQGPVERLVGLSRLVVHTASAGTDATIPGIAAGDAEGRRRRCGLTPRRAGRGVCTWSARCSSRPGMPVGCGRWPWRCWPDGGSG